MEVVWLFMLIIILNMSLLMNLHISKKTVWNQYVLLNVTLGSKRFKVFVCTIYRPPDNDMKLFNDEIEIIIE